MKAIDERLHHPLQVSFKVFAQPPPHPPPQAHMGQHTGKRPQGKPQPDPTRSLAGLPGEAQDSPLGLRQTMTNTLV